MLSLAHALLEGVKYLEDAMGAGHCDDRLVVVDGTRNNQLPDLS
jgi:hypothetical protein